MSVSAAPIIDPKVSEKLHGERVEGREILFQALQKNPAKLKEVINTAIGHFQATYDAFKKGEKGYHKASESFFKGDGRAGIKNYNACTESELKTIYSEYEASQIPKLAKIIVDTVAKGKFLVDSTSKDKLENYLASKLNEWSPSKLSKYEAEAKAKNSAYALCTEAHVSPGISKLFNKILKDTFRSAAQKAEKLAANKGLVQALEDRPEARFGRELKAYNALPPLVYSVTIDEDSARKLIAQAAALDTSDEVPRKKTLIQKFKDFMNEEVSKKGIRSFETLPEGYALNQWGKNELGYLSGELCQFATKLLELKKATFDANFALHQASYQRLVEIHNSNPESLKLPQAPGKPATAPKMVVTQKPAEAPPKPAAAAAKAEVPPPPPQPASQSKEPPKQPPAATNTKKSAASTAKPESSSKTEEPFQTPAPKKAKEAATPAADESPTVAAETPEATEVAEASTEEASEVSEVVETTVQEEIVKASTVERTSKVARVIFTVLAVLSLVALPGIIAAWFIVPLSTKLTVVLLTSSLISTLFWGILAKRAQRV
jgi:hypothetical protein